VTEIQSDLFQRKRYQEFDYEKKIESIRAERQSNYEKTVEHDKFLDVALDIAKSMDKRMNAD